MSKYVQILEVLIRVIMVLAMAIAVLQSLVYVLGLILGVGTGSIMVHAFVCCVTGFACRLTLLYGKK